MKQMFRLLLPLLLPLLSGCVVAAEGEEPTPGEISEQTNELEGVPQEFELEAQANDPTIPDLSLPELQGTTTEIEETERPDPDPWKAEGSGDPFRPDPDPWTPPSGTQSGKSSSGAKD
jgi:hypothetical protein